MTPERDTGRGTRFPLGLPLTLALSPQAGRGDREALVARGLASDSFV